MGIGIAPCKGCGKRHIGCHGECEGYQAWKKEHDRARRELQADVNSYIHSFETQCRIDKARRGKKKITGNGRYSE